MADAGPYALLTGMERQCATVRASLGIAGGVQDDWTGVAFRAGGHRLVLERKAVRELIPVATLSFVPGAPDWVRGVTNLRGQVLPVYDLGRLLGGEHATLARITRIIVFEYRDALAGLLVDEVLGFRRFAASARRAAPEAPVDWSGCFPYSYGDGQHEWLELDLLALSTSPPFTRMTLGAQA